MNRATTDFIEHAGLVFESEGLPRMAGRVLGYLMICSPPEATIADLMEALQASNGSISTMTRLLEDQGYLRRVSKPGIRKDFFALPDNVGITIITAAQKSLGNLRTLFAAAAELSPKSNVREASEFFEFLTDEYAKLPAKWEEHRATRKRTRRPK